MTSRFDNLSVEEMVARHADLKAEIDALAEAAIAKAKAECPVKVGKVYKIKELAKHPDYNNFDALGGRRILVKYLKPQFAWGRWKFVVEGPLERPTASPQRIGYVGGRFTLKMQEVLVSSIDLTTEADPPDDK